MFDDAHQDSERSKLSRLLRDPVKLRKRARIAGVVLVLAAAVASDGLSGTVPGIALPLLWLALPPVALAIGYGDAFFIEHGVGVRRSVLTIVLGALLSLAACVILSTAAMAEGGALARFLAAGLYSLLYAGILALLSSLVGLGIGRGLGYAGRRIQQLDDEQW